MAKYRWKPIEDLPSNWKEKVSEELTSSARAWDEVMTKLEGSDALKHFNDRLRREWAIETGIIEGLYTIDRGTTETLIEHGIVASLIAHDASDLPAEEIVDIVGDHLDTLEGVFDFVARRRELSTGYIKEMHAELTRHLPFVMGRDQLGRRTETELIRGDWKKRPNNPTRPDGELHEYCPPEHVQSEMDRLISMHLTHADVPPEIESAWLHHRFTQIHPFQDGNGRVARALASIIAIRAGWFPLVIRRDDRAEYIEALEKADIGDLSTLVSLFARLHMNSFINARILGQSILREEAIINAIGKEHKAKGSPPPIEWQRVFTLSETLKDQATKRLEDTALKVSAQFENSQDQNTPVIEYVAKDDDPVVLGQIERWNNWRQNLPDKDNPPSSLRLRLLLNRQFTIVIVFYSPGAPFRGMRCASAFLSVSTNDENQPDQCRVYDTISFSFDVSFDDDEVLIRRNFGSWLDGAILQALGLIRTLN